MSEENVKAFIEKLNSDETFRNQIADADSNEARLHLAKEAGIELSTEEFTGIIEQLSSEELSEDELDTVAGGASWGKMDVSGFKKLSSKWKVEEGESIIK